MLNFCKNRKCFGKLTLFMIEWNYLKKRHETWNMKQRRKRQHSQRQGQKYERETFTHPHTSYLSPISPIYSWWKKLVMWRNFRFQYTTDVEKSEILLDLVEFQNSTHDRCEEIWNLSCFWLWNLFCGNLRYFLRNLFCRDLRAFTWKKIEPKIV